MWLENLAVLFGIKNIFFTRFWGHLRGRLKEWFYIARAYLWLSEYSKAIVIMLLCNPCEMYLLNTSNHAPRRNFSMKVWQISLLKVLSESYLKRSMCYDIVITCLYVWKFGLFLYRLMLSSWMLCYEAPFLHLGVLCISCVQDVVTLVVIWTCLSYAFVRTIL